jgi:signal transduction histidine kinase
VRIGAFGRRGLFLLAGVILVLIAIGFGFFTRVRSRILGFPYQDSFSGGKADEWRALGGTWEVVDGTMRNDSDERGAKLLTGSGYWRDYSLEAEIKLLGPDGDAGLIARSSDEEEGVDSYSGYYAGLRNRDGALVLGRADHVWKEGQAVSVPGGVRAFHWYHLKLIVSGCDIAASASDPADGTKVTASMIEKDCSVSGRIGLRSYSSGGQWRNVRATPATHADLQALLKIGTHSDADQTSKFNAAQEGARRLGNDNSSEEENQGSADHSGAAIPQPINSLRLVSISNPLVVTVRGVVVLTTPVLYVQDPTGGAAVFAPQSPPLKLGDEIEVTGKPEPHDFSSVLRDASVRLLWARAPIPPVSVTASQAAGGAFDATFIEVDGQVLNKQDGPGNTLILDLQDGEQSFRAIMSRGRGDSLFRKLKQKSLLRLRGVSVIDSEYTHNLTPFVLLLPSTDDIDVLAGPPWWSAGHVAAIAVTTLILILVAQFFYSRAERWRLRAVLEERERLAHEMHDTLAQSFAGIGFQLQALRNDLHDKNPAAHKQLDLACDLVRHSHEESRRSIATLRPESLDSVGLLPALDSCARRMVDGGSLEVAIWHTGEVRPVPIRISDTLFRIGQEAIANAVRHARPTSLKILLNYEKHKVCLAVEDNGMGFTCRGDLLGFGLRGMRKRADSISAVLTVTSAPGQGTRVNVVAPLPPRFDFKGWPRFIWQHAKENRSNGEERERRNSYSYRG